MLRRVSTKVRSWSVTLWTRLDTNQQIALSRTHVWVAAVIAAVVGMFMLSVALRMAGPTVHPDEWGSLINGQALLGHSEAPIPTGSFYPVGYGFVTALGALVTGSMSGAYRFSLLTNLGFAVLTAMAAGLLASRAFEASKRMSQFVALLVFVMPGTLVSAMFSWPEIAIRLAYISLVIAVIAVAKRRSLLQIAALSFYAGLLPGLHGRFTLIVPLVLALVVWWFVESLTSRAAVIISFLSTGIGYYMARAVNKYVKSAVYIESYNQENRLLARLFRPWVWPALIRTMVGQSWYLIATTFGLTAVGLLYAVLRLREVRSRKEIAQNPRNVGLLFVVLSTCVVVFTGGLQLLYGNRGDHLIYGRYVEMLAPVLLALSCVALEKKYRESQFVWFLSALSIFVFSIFYVLIDGGDGVKASALRKSIVYPNIVGFDFVRYFFQPMLVTWGIAFCLVAVGFWWLARTKGMMSLLAIMLLLAVGVMYSGHRTMLGRTDKLERSGTSISFALEGSPEVIGYDGGIRNDMAYYYLRYKMHPVKLVREFFSVPNATISPKYNCIYGFGNHAPTQGDWAIVAEEPVLERVLWKRLTAAHC